MTLLELAKLPHVVLHINRATMVPEWLKIVPGGGNDYEWTPNQWEKWQFPNGKEADECVALHGGHSVPCVDLSIEGKPRIRPSEEAEGTRGGRRAGETETPPVHTYHVVGSSGGSGGHKGTVRHIRLRKKNRVSAQECFEHNERQYLA